MSSQTPESREVGSAARQAPTPAAEAGASDSARSRSLLLRQLGCDRSKDPASNHRKHDRAGAHLNSALASGCRESQNRGGDHDRAEQNQGWEEIGISGDHERAKQQQIGTYASEQHLKPAGTLEYDTLRALDALPMIMVALIEETSKMLVPAAVLLINRRIQWPAAVVLGIASGTGFATLETMGYGFTALLSGGLAALDETLLLRALLAPAGHVAWTGLSVGAIGRIRGTSHRSRTIFVAIAVFVAVVILHAVWDASSSSLVRVVVALLSFIALMLTLVAARRAEGSLAPQMPSL